jgi:pimeloyl-ACP methyl ester carboxylesterase
MGASPTVVFDAALGGSSLSWCLVEPALAALAPTFTYDRAGMGWSEIGPLPRSLERQSADLERLLALAGVSAPYILVGHSYGALVVQYFAARHVGLVAGLVLVDPPALDAWSAPDAAHQAQLARGIKLARRGAWAARIGLARLVAALVASGALRPAAALATMVSGGKLRTRSDFNFAPAAHMPAAWKPAMRRFWTRPAFYAALASQMESLPADAALVKALPPPVVPTVVLSAANTPAAQLDEHARLAASGPHGLHWVARSSGHWIPVEDPELVVRAVSTVLSSQS